VLEDNPLLCSSWKDWLQFNIIKEDLFMVFTLKKSIAVTSVVCCLLGGISLVGCTNRNHQESTGQYVDSSAITAKVKAALIADKSLSSLPITVKTYKNVVQLSGFVNSRYQSSRAESVASQVEGVVEVKNDLIIKKY
jgi:hyperosmotically inducible protein